MSDRLRPFVLFLLIAAALHGNAAQAQSTAVTYQGELKTAQGLASGDFEFSFRVLDTPSGAGNVLLSYAPGAPVPVVGGRFTTVIEGLAGVMNGAPRYLEVSVRQPGAVAFTVLEPRQALTSAPGALVALTVANGSVGALQINDGQVQRRLTADCPAGQFLRGITSLGLPVCAADASGPANAFVQGGNAFGAPAVLGSSDNQPLELRVNGARVARFSGHQLTNVLLGDPGNTIGPNATSATIGGGGWATLFGAGSGDNAAYDNGGTVAGGIGNTVGTDDGPNNSHQYGSIGGGFFNTASGAVSVIAGGQTNTASGEGAAVPGGFSNSATGAHSFAAGRNAQALHNNSFVWSGQTAAFASTGAGQFIARAPGGIGFNANTIPASTDVVLGSRGNSSTDVWVKSGTGNTGFNFAVFGTDNSNAAMYIARYDGGSTYYDYMLFNAGGHIDMFRNVAIHGTASTPANAWTTWSDARLKREVRPLRGVLDRLLNLQGVSYEYRDDVDFGNYSAGRKTGFIAQEVERVFPEWVGNDAKGYRQLTIQGFEALTVEALRELKLSSDARIESLERDNAELRARLQRLEQRILRDRY